MFVVKKLIGSLFMPLPLAIAFIVIGTALFIFTTKNKAAIFFNVSGIVILLLFTTPWLPNNALHDLEYHYPSTTPSGLDYEVEAIVVLGCDHKNDEPMPLTSQLFHCSLARTTEAVYWARHYQDAHIIFTGYGAHNPVANSEMNAELAKQLGLPEYRVSIFTAPKDTKEESELLAPLLRERKFILITDASHMPRAYRYFTKQGLTPIAVPTRHLTTELAVLPNEQLSPNSRWLQQSERLWYESMGLIAQFFDQ